VTVLLPEVLLSVEEADLPGQLDLQALQDPQDHREPRVQQDPQDHREPQVQQDLQAHKAHKAHKEYKV
jgi:hypothetical protein